MSKATACALIALCSATDFLSAADDNPNFVQHKGSECYEDEGIFSRSPVDENTTTCCTSNGCETCTQYGEYEVCTVSCNDGACCWYADDHEEFCDYMVWGRWAVDLVVVGPEDESGLPGIDEFQADDSLVVLDDSEQYTPIGDSEVLIEFFVFEDEGTLIDEFELQVGVFELQTDDSSDDLEVYTPIGISEEFVWESVWHYTPIGDAQDELYMWIYAPTGYAELAELPLQSILDSHQDRAADFRIEEFELQGTEDEIVVDTEDTEPQADEGELVVETSDESTPEQDTTNPGVRRRNDRRRHAGRN
jgi:hypothetical protein